MNQDRMNQTVIGIYDDRNKAKQAEQELLRNGFSKDIVDVSSNTTQSSDADSNRTHGFFGSLFGSSDDAVRHSEAAKTGTVVTVHTTSMQEAERAASILDKFGTLDVSDSRYNNFQGNRIDEGSSTGFTDRNVGDKSIPVIEEDLQLGKREVETGGMRLRSRIVERPVEEHMRLREEHVSVERHPVNRPINEADLNTFKDTTIEAREHAERPVVNKQARVVEEVNLKKEVTEHDETIRDSVRNTEVDVEKLKNKDRNWDTDRDNPSKDRF